MAWPRNDTGSVLPHLHATPKEASEQEKDVSTTERSRSATRRLGRFLLAVLLASTFLAWTSTRAMAEEPMTIYVGGEGASDDAGDPTQAATPFATLKKAFEYIRWDEASDYEIQLQDDLALTQVAFFVSDTPKAVTMDLAGHSVELGDGFIEISSPDCSLVVTSSQGDSPSISSDAVVGTFIIVCERGQTGTSLTIDGVDVSNAQGPAVDLLGGRSELKEGTLRGGGSLNAAVLVGNSEKAGQDVDPVFVMSGGKVEGHEDAMAALKVDRGRAELRGGSVEMAPKEKASAVAIVGDVWHAFNDAELVVDGADITSKESGDTLGTALRIVRGRVEIKGGSVTGGSVPEITEWYEKASEVVPAISAGTALFPNVSFEMSGGTVDGPVVSYAKETKLMGGSVTCKSKGGAAVSVYSGNTVISYGSSIEASQGVGAVVMSGGNLTIDGGSTSGSVGVLAIGGYLTITGASDGSSGPTVRGTLGKYGSFTLVEPRRHFNTGDDHFCSGAVVSGEDATTVISGGLISSASGTPVCVPDLLAVGRRGQAQVTGGRFSSEDVDGPSATLAYLLKLSDVPQGTPVACQQNESNGTIYVGRQAISEAMERDGGEWSALTTGDYGNLGDDVTLRNESGGSITVNGYTVQQDGSVTGKSNVPAPAPPSTSTPSRPSTPAPKPDYTERILEKVRAAKPTIVDSMADYANVETGDDVLTWTIDVTDEVVLDVVADDLIAPIVHAIAEGSGTSVSANDVSMTLPGTVEARSEFSSQALSGAVAMAANTRELSAGALTLTSLVGSSLEIEAGTNAKPLTFAFNFTSSMSDTPETEVQTVDVVRLYNEWTGTHFYSTDANEVDVLVDLGWTNEGVAWKSVKPGTHSDLGEIARLYNEDTGEHIWSGDSNEVGSLVKLGWKNEGVACSPTMQTAFR